MTTEPTGGASPDPLPADPKAITKLREVQQILNHTYLHGVYLAVNAIPDVHLLFDGPACGYDKAFLVAGTHDLFSRLFQFPAHHRVTVTDVQADSLAFDRDDEIIRMIDQIHRSGEAALTLLSAMPMAAITGIDYPAIIRRATAETGACIALIPPKTFHHDWLVGYAEALCSLVDHLVEEQPHAGDNSDVAVVGYLFDRNEGDHTGNVTEIRRVCEALSLRLVSVWLDGSPTSALGEVGRASTLISLPYGRRAAQAIAAKTGAAVVPLDLPVGLRASRQWILRLGEATGRTAEAERFVDAELARCVPVLDLAIADFLQDRRFAFSGDPFLGEAILTALDEVGCVPDHAVLFGAEESTANLVRVHQLNVVKTEYCARLGDVLERGTQEIDFFVGNSYFHYLVRLQDARKPFVELGFPSYRHHCLAEHPFLFFRGFVNLVNRVVNGG